MEERQKQFKESLNEVDIPQKLLMASLKSAKLRKQHFISAKRLAMEEKKTEAPLSPELAEAVKSLSELVVLEVTSTHSARVLKSVKQLFQMVELAAVQAGLGTAIKSTDLVPFLGSIINRWNKFSEIVAEALKCIVALSPLAFVREDVFCSLMQTLEEIMKRPSMHPHFILKEQVMWAIGNMAGDCPQFIRRVAASDVFVPQIIDLMSYKYESIKSTALWCLYGLTQSAYCEEKKHFTSPRMLEELQAILKKGKDKEKAIAIWVLANVTQLELPLGLGLVAGIIDILISELQATADAEYCRGALSCLGNLLADEHGRFNQIIALNKKLYANLSELLKVEKVRKECMWILSLFAADPTLCTIIGESEALINFLTGQLSESVDYTIRKEALLTLYYLASQADGKYVKAVGNEKVVNFCVYALDTQVVNDVQMVMCALSIIDLTLDSLPDATTYLKGINGGVVVEKMIYKYAQNVQISGLANKIVQKLSSSK